MPAKDLILLKYIFALPRYSGAGNLLWSPVGHSLGTVTTAAFLALVRFLPVRSKTLKAELSRFAVDALTSLLRYSISTEG